MVTNSDMIKSKAFQARPNQTEVGEILLVAENNCEMKKEVLFQKFQGRNSKNVVKNPEQKGKKCRPSKIVSTFVLSNFVTYLYIKLK